LGIEAFATRSLDDYLKDNDERILRDVEKETEDYILNVNETDYINHLVSKFKIDIPQLDFDSLSITAEVQKKLLPPWRGLPETTIDADVVTYHIPCTGDITLLCYRPNTYIEWSIALKTSLSSEVSFEASVTHNDKEELARQTRSILTDFKKQMGYFVKEVEDYNNSLRSKIEQMFRQRKKVFLEKNEVAAFLNIPIKKKESLPATYAIPTPQFQKSINVKPQVTVVGYAPEPTLDQSTYSDILQTIHDIGKVFERLPATYSKKSEEDLRDHILVYLEPRYQGATTGETFNSMGKTDILIRANNSNVFIAECLIWDGQKYFLGKILQLINNLTWRDSKAAVIVFVRNKDMSSVIAEVQAVSPTHSNYLGFVSKQDDSWFNYRFHLNGDRNREIKLAVLLFHFPIS
jgi:hypothetical protein